jgi:hypothetical protein
MFLITNDRVPRRWWYLLFAVGLLVIFGPLALLTMHVRVKPKA